MLKPFLCGLLLLLAAPGHAAGAAAAPLPEASHSTIGYPTVEAALAALRAKPGVKISSSSDGWTVVEDSTGKNMVLWSFTPLGHPAHPAVVKRSVIEKAGRVSLDMQTLCGAGKEACDDLVRQFMAMNEQLASSTETKPAKAAANPREKEATAFAEHWLDMTERGDYDASFALLSPIFQANLTPQTWRKTLRETHEALGALKTRTLKRVVWYQDPADAPLPGTYAAVEFDSVYAKADQHFRFVILHSQNGEPFKVMRDESTVTKK